MEDTVYCEGCGSILIKEKCIYCGTSNDVYFLTKEEYNKIQMSHGYIECIFNGFDPLKTFFGRRVVVRN